MTQAAKAEEPSMEEILASIRRIIADDDTAKAAAKTPEPPRPTPSAPAAPAPRPAAPQAPRAPEPRATAPAPAKTLQDDIDAIMSQPDAKPNQGGAIDSTQNDILDLTEAMETSAGASDGFRRIDAENDVVFSEIVPQPEPSVAPAVDQARRQFRHTTADRSLLSPSTSAAVDSAFNSLAQTVLVQNSRTLDDLVREMLRPMLKAWLDDNLPNMVERLVRAEIERVSRGRA